MEQLVARRAHNPKVVGSSPAPATNSLVNRVKIIDSVYRTRNDTLDSSSGSDFYKQESKVVAFYQVQLPQPLACLTRIKINVINIRRGME